MNIQTVISFRDKMADYRAIMAITRTQRQKNCQEEERLCAVALDHVAALPAKPVVRPEQHPLPERSSKLAVHSHQRIAEHHVGHVPVVHQRSPSNLLGAHSEASQSLEHLVPAPFEGRRDTPRHHPTRLRRLVELSIPNPPCTTGLYCFNVLS